MIAITSKCWLVKMWQMRKCENVTNYYKRLRILKKFLRSYVYKRRGTPMLCPKSPHRLYCCCCRCCCRCRCRCRCRCHQAVGAVNAVTAVTAFKLLQLLPLSLLLCHCLCLYLCYRCNHWTLTFKNVSCIAHAVVALRVLHGTSAMQLLRVQVGVQT